MPRHDIPRVQGTDEIVMSDLNFALGSNAASANADWGALLDSFNGADGYNAMMVEYDGVTALGHFLTSAPVGLIGQINFNRLSGIALSSVISLVRSVDISDFSRLDAINDVRHRLQTAMVPDPRELEEESKSDDEGKSDDGSGHGGGRGHRDSTTIIPRSSGR